MSVLGYTEIMRLLTGNDEYQFEEHILTISKYGISELRLNILKQLAISKRATISHILISNDSTNTGGTYKSINSFFKALEKEKILEEEKVGNRTYWKFTEKCTDFSKYLTTI